VQHDTRPSYSSHAGLGRRLLTIVRRLIGLVGLLYLAVAVSIFVPLLFTSRAFGAAGDEFQRILLGYWIAVAIAGVVAVIGFGDWSLATMLRSRVTWVVPAALGLAIAWAIVGIDSTRSVTSLPEASLVFPGAVETGRRAEPAEGGMSAVARAALSVAMTSDAEASDIEAFYASELRRRGWIARRTNDRPDDPERLVEWDREDFTVQLRFQGTDGAGSTTFAFVLFGPVQ
jgi:hypothetical protein